MGLGCSCNIGGSGDPVVGFAGLGDVCFDDMGNVVACVDASGQMPTETTIPVIFSPSPTTPPTPTPSPSSPLNLNALLSQWTNVAGSILKSASGANPTYQAVGPGGSVTYYGSPGALPGLPANLMSSPAGTIFGIPTSVVLIAILTIVGVSVLGGHGRR